MTAEVAEYSFGFIAGQDNIQTLTPFSRQCLTSDTGLSCTTDVLLRRVEAREPLVSKLIVVGQW